jgi:hypothetical protein
MPPMVLTGSDTSGGEPLRNWTDTPIRDLSSGWTSTSQRPKPP